MFNIQYIYSFYKTNFFGQGILCLSTKYVIRYLQQQFVSLFLAKFPSTLNNYTSKSATLSRENTNLIMSCTPLLLHGKIMSSKYASSFYCIARLPHKQTRILKERPMDILWKDKAMSLVGREWLQWTQTSLSHVFLLNFQRAPLSSCQSSLRALARHSASEWHQAHLRLHVIT